MQKRRRSHETTSALVHDRLRRWRDGECAALWAEAIRNQTPVSAVVPTAEQQQRLNARRAVRLAREGAYRKAVTALTSEGIAALTDDVQAALLAKHPQDPTARDDDDLLRVHELPPMRAHKPFSAEEVRLAIERTPSASAAGGSGLSFTHLKEMTRLPCTDDRKGLAAQLVKLCDRAARR